MFLVVGFVIFGIAALLAASVFGYEAYLTNQREDRAAKLEEYDRRAAGEDGESVKDLVRLQSRLVAAESILNAHAMPSGLFDMLEQETLENVRFDSFDYVVADDGTIEIRVAGVARTFNALAAQSEAFAADESDIRRAIFSGIAENDDGLVTFELSANVEPDLVTMPRYLPQSWIGDVEAAAPADAAAPATGGDAALEPTP